MKFLVVDDHPVLREGLAELLGRTFAPATVVLACDAQEAYAALEIHDDLDVVIIDLNMPRVTGTDAIVEIGRRRVDVPIVVLSSSENPRDIRTSIALGALGYVPKSASQQTLTAAIRLVLDGNVYVPPLMLREPGPATQTKDGREEVRLTPRQLEILALLAQGESNPGIAYKLGLAEKTVKVHITTIFKLLNVVNRTQAAAAARSAGLI